MLWSAAGCESFESLPVVELVARINVRVNQLSSFVRTVYHDVVNGASTPMYASGFDYGSEANQEIQTEEARLGGEQTIVFVECNFIVGANNLGRSIIDMQSSHHFYFEVPMVRWGLPCNRILPISFI